MKKKVTRRFRKWVPGLACLCLALPAFTASADSFPSQPVRIVLPMAPGAAADLMVRLIGDRLSKRWGQTVIVENRTGGNTVIAMEAVAKSKPDGHTILYTVNDSFTTVPHLYKNVSVDPLSELAPVNLTAKVDMIVTTNPSTQLSSFQDIVTRARAKPGELSYGSYGAGSGIHLAVESFKDKNQLELTHVPYRGVAPAMMAATSGEVGFTMVGYGTAKAMIDDKRLKPLAIAGPERLQHLPEVPTTHELGYPEVDLAVWWGFAVPAQTPAARIKQLNADISAVLNEPEVRKQIEDRYLIILNQGPDAFGKAIQQGFTSQGAAVRKIGLSFN